MRENISVLDVFQTVLFINYILELFRRYKKYHKRCLGERKRKGVGCSEVSFMLLV